jgi:hypothetical protein
VSHVTKCVKKDDALPFSSPTRVAYVLHSWLFIRASSCVAETELTNVALGGRTTIPKDG